MQRVVSIHLNGNVYQLEENGYNTLFAYLDAAEARLKDSPDRAQRLADLEQLIAEKCQACLGPHKTVVTSTEVARILSDMDPAAAAAAGEPAGAASDAKARSSANTANGTGSGSQPRTGACQPRRLWQIREGGMIGGVCLGLATFFHVDVTLVRILFAVFAFATAGWGILVYVGLMFILPRATNIAEATTPGTGPQKWAWDDGWPWDRHGWPWDRHGWPWDRPAAAPLDREARRELRFQRRMARMSSGPPSLGHTLLIAFFVMLAFGWLAFWMRGGFFWGWPVFWGGPSWGAPHWVGIVLFFVFVRFLMWPLRAARWGWYGHPAYGLYHPFSPWMAMWHTIVWIGTILFFFWLAYNFVPGVHEFLREFQTNWPDGRFEV